jgi:23S rRNA pseudouridine1911/1915/1917 synthase
MEKHNIVADTADYLILNKNAGILVQGSENNESSLLDLLEPDIKQSNLHLLTRIDRPVSGVVLFSKSKSFNKHYLEEQENGKIIKTYIAIVEGHPDKQKFQLTHYHRQDSKFKKARISDTQIKGYKKIELECECIQKLDNYTIVSMELKSGKFHQIRAQLSHIGHPIKGDVKYGARRKNPDRSIYLHAYKISFSDLNQKVQSYTAQPIKENTLWTHIDE